MAVQVPTIDFMVAGFSKCGTTSLCDALLQHPDIFIPDVKEPRYFSSANFEKRHKTFARMYAPARPGQKLGDGSPVYSSAALADLSIARIRKNNPECRFVFIARHPRKRIESFFREMHHSGAHFGVAPPFKLSEFLDDHAGAVQNTLFFDRISCFIEAFGRDAVLPVFLEDFYANSDSVVRACCAHIGVAPEQLPPLEAKVLNAGSDKLYDTRLLRKLRNHPLTGFRIAALAPEQQNKLFRKLGLRRPFRDRSVIWDERAKLIYQNTVVPQARKFLQLSGKPPDFWALDM